MRYPSIKTLMTIPGVDRATALELRGAIYGVCGRLGSARMSHLNAILGGHGVEAIRGPEHWDWYYGDIIAEFVSMGDTYNATIVRDCETGRFQVTTWGDWVEAWEKRNRRRLP